MNESLRQVFLYVGYFFIFAFAFFFISGILIYIDCHGTRDDVDKKLRESINDFDPLIKYTERVVKGEIPYEVTPNENIRTDKILYYKRPCGLYTIEEIDDQKKGLYILFWEMLHDKFDPFSSGAKLSRKIKELFKQNSLKDTKLSIKEINEINQKINQINL